MLVPQLPPGDAPGAPEESGPGVEEEPLEMLAHLEQLTVHLKEVVRDKDSQLATFETQLKVRPGYRWVCWPACVVLTLCVCVHAPMCIAMTLYACVCET